MDKKSMKIIKGLMLILILVIIFCFFSIVETTYPRDAVVTQVNDNLVIAQDLDGQRWKFYKDNLFVGQEVTLIMNTNNTDSNIYDDLVEQVLTK